MVCQRESGLCLTPCLLRCTRFAHLAFEEWQLVYEQRRVDLATFRALPASTWGHCPQVLCFTLVWDTPDKEKVAKWSSAPASILEGFNEIYVVYGPKKPYKTREKRQSCQIDPCLPPYNGNLPSLRLGCSKGRFRKRLPLMKCHNL